MTDIVTYCDVNTCEDCPRYGDDCDGDSWIEPVSEAYWLVSQMENYCCGYNEVEYNGKWYYTVHHA